MGAELVHEGEYILEPYDGEIALDLTQEGEYGNFMGDGGGGGGSINLQAKTNIAPTTSSQTITPDVGYDGLSSVQINAIPSDYVGSGITRRSGSDLSASGATVTVPAGYYENAATKTVASGSASPAASISATGASVSTGTNTLTLSKTVSNTPQVSAGYVSSGTAGNSSVSLTASVTTIGSTTYRASTSNQTIASGTYHSAAATIAAVSQTNLTADNIKSGTTISISNGQSNLWSVTGTYSGGGGGSVNVATTTWTNTSTSTVSHQFTGLSGTPKAAFLRCTTQLTRSSSNTYYYIADIVWDGTETRGNYHLRSSGAYTDVPSTGTAKYNVTVGTNSITFSSTATSRSSAPGSFYNGTYELTYVY